MDILEFILFLLVKITHFGKNFRVSWYLSNEDVVKFESKSSLTNKFIHMSNLIKDFITVWNDSVKFFKGLKRFVVIVESLVNKTKVVDGFNTVCFNTNGFKEELFCSIIVLCVVETIALVN